MLGFQSEVFGGCQMVHKTDFVGAPAVDVITGEDQVFGPSESDIAWQAESRQSGYEAFPDSGQTDDAVRSRKANIACQCELQPTAQAVAMHRGQDDLLRRVAGAQGPFK